MAHSKQHYRLVSPPADTQAEITERLRMRRILDQVGHEMGEKFATLTTENVQAALDWQRNRIKELQG